MYPNKTEIAAAVQVPILVKDPILKDGAVVRYESNRLAMFSGGFSQVFQMQKDGTEWAFKVWTHEIMDNERRYGAIKGHLLSRGLPYFVNFDYVVGGLLVNGEAFDTLRMEWINGLSLAEYINSKIDDSDALNTLAAKFLKMTNDLHEHQIAHGDLQHDNIFINKDCELILIDYDAICVPQLVNQPDITCGRPGFQHPSRLSAGYLASLKNDYFSELVIYLSILAVAELPILWDKYQVMLADDRLLFKPEDFLNFRESAIRRDLMLLSTTIQQLVKQMDGYLAAHLLFSPLVS